MKLKQVMINILGNSVKFTNTPGSVSLTVEQIAQADGMCTLRFVMKDTGIGMDKEFIPKIFESFSQEDVTTTNKYGGSGLGMAITRDFVEMMHGDILVESEKGVGSVFTVTVKLTGSECRVTDEHGMELPEGLRAVIMLTGYNWDIIEDEAKTDGVDGILAKPLFSDILQREIYRILSKKKGMEEKAPETAAAGSAEEILAGRRVLMAEDVEQNAEILADLLELEDIESEHARNGREAVEMFADSAAATMTPFSWMCVCRRWTV